MPQVTLSVPNEKLPLFKDLLFAMGLENKNVKKITPKSASRSAGSQSLQNSANNFFRKHFSWEYFSNELEFE